jgi:ribosomal protein S27AE
VVKVLHLMIEVLTAPLPVVEARKVKVSHSQCPRCNSSGCLSFHGQVSLRKTYAIEAYVV